MHARRWDAKFLAIVRPAVGWDVARGVSLFVGYGYIPSYADDGLTHEQRTWEQALLTTRLGSGVQLGFRPRLEQRWLLGNAAIGHRLRLWGRVAVPVSKDVSIALVEELFVGINAVSWAPQGFDQNRLFVGPAVQLGKEWRVELGYLNNYLASGMMIHVAAANVFVSL